MTNKFNSCALAANEQQAITGGCFELLLGLFGGLGGGGGDTVPPQQPLIIPPQPHGGNCGCNSCNSGGCYRQQYVTQPYLKQPQQVPIQQIKKQVQTVSQSSIQKRRQ